jgi:hypothetical protein
MSIPGNGHLPASASLPDHSYASDSDAEPEPNYSPIAEAATPHHHLESGNGISALDLASDDDKEADGEEEEREDGDLMVGEAAARAFS